MGRRAKAREVAGLLWAVHRALVKGRILGRLIPFGLFLLVLMLVLHTGDRYSLRFYEVSAQVIPVILLVLAVELRVFAFPRGYRFKLATSVQQLRQRVETQSRAQEWMGFFAVFVVLTAGEVVALVELAYEDTGGPAAGGVVLGSIAAGLLMIAFAAVAPRGGDD